MVLCVLVSPCSAMMQVHGVGLCLVGFFYELLFLTLAMDLLEVLDEC